MNTLVKTIASKRLDFKLSFSIIILNVHAFDNKTKFSTTAYLFQYVLFMNNIKLSVISSQLSFLVNQTKNVSR
jgi:hypothetical protein